MRLNWSTTALASAARFMEDQPGMHAINVAVAALVDDPLPGPPDGVHHGDYHRLRVGQYRVVYDVKDDLITVRRVDRVLG